jgi:hypothetical protein
MIAFQGFLIALDHLFPNCYFLLTLLKLRELHVAIRSSPQRSESLAKACHACNVDSIKPTLDCITRWNSTFDMIKTGQRLKPV